MRKSLMMLMMLFFGSLVVQGQESSISKKQALLIGTFHFNNPGADVAKTKSFDILNPDSQMELEKISDSIKDFNPSKIFVEWPYDEQGELDSLYKIFLTQGQFIDTTYSNFRRKNEIFQLACRTAKKLGHQQIYAIDYSTEFPFDSVQQVMVSANQEYLQKALTQKIETFVNDFDEKISQGFSLTELLLHLNDPELRIADIGFYLDIMNKVGDVDNFIGPYLTSEWYRRNIYMWSLVEKKVKIEDERIMVLLGASHISIIDQLLTGNGFWDVVEFEDILRN